MRKRTLLFLSMVGQMGFETPIFETNRNAIFEMAPDVNSLNYNTIEFE